MERAGAQGKRFLYLAIAAVIAGVIGGSRLIAQQPADRAVPAAGDNQAHAFSFKDAGAERGIFPHAADIRGHAAGWGDADGDGWIDLYIGAFFTQGSKANLLLRNREGHFALDDQEALRLQGRPTGSLFADLDNDGDLDLYVSSMPKAKSAKPPKSGEKQDPPLSGCTLFRNDGNGQFVDISAGNGACPAAFGGRSATVLDFDGDGLLDLLVGEDPLKGYNGSPTRSSRLFRNTGNLAFEDATEAAGIPAGIPGYGVAAGDVNGDAWPDLFICAGPDSNVLFLNDGTGRFREAAESRKTFLWKDARGDNMVCGVTIADANRDGLPDIVLGPHFEAQWRTPVPPRLYLNRGVTAGVPAFEDVTDRVGIKPLPLKAPHVELQDFDNDGWSDLYASMVKFDATGRPHPMIFRNGGVKDGLPQFAEDVLAVNDYSTAEDRATKRPVTMFEKIVAEKKVIYMAPGPSGDFDNDGRLDLFLASWWMESPSLLLQNQTPGGHWLDVTVEGTDRVNRMGIGARVRIYPAGKLGDTAAIIGFREIATGYGYASSQPAVAHFGLGQIAAVDIEVLLPHGRGKLERKGVKANQRLAIKQ